MARACRVSSLVLQLQVSRISRRFLREQWFEVAAKNRFKRVARKWKILGGTGINSQETKLPQKIFSNARNYIDCTVIVDVVWFSSQCLVLVVTPVRSSSNDASSKGDFKWNLQVQVLFAKTKTPWTINAIPQQISPFISPRSASQTLMGASIKTHIYFSLHHIRFAELWAQSRVLGALRAAQTIKMAPALPIRFTELLQVSNKLRFSSFTLEYYWHMSPVNQLYSWRRRKLTGTWGLRALQQPGSSFWQS